MCSERDTEYWLSGNAPVILVCSHPGSHEAWWVSLKEWFSEPSRRAARRVEFDKGWFLPGPVKEKGTATSGGRPLLLRTRA